MRFVCISDTHGRHEDIALPEGDVLIHAGDMSKRGEWDQIRDFAVWLEKLPYRKKIIIAGNHDFLFEKKPELAQSYIRMAHSAVYLQDEGTTLENGIKVWGSPWQPYFNDWAFNLPRGEALREKWELIPTDTNILITHGPPADVGDLVSRGERVGCEELLKITRRIPLKAHIFGHVHEGYGIYNNRGVISINASSLDRAYCPVNAPIVFDINTSGEIEIHREKE